MSFYTEKKFPYIISKKQNKDSLPYFLSPYHRKSPPKISPSSTGKRAAFDTLKKASLAVESALILPLFLLSMLALFSLLDAYRICIEEHAALYTTAKKTAITFAQQDTDTLETLYPQGYLTCDQNISYQVPFAPFPLPALTLPCHVRVHIWCGFLGTETDNLAGSSSEMVYVADRETVYHTASSCSHLELQIYQKSLNDAKKSRNADGKAYQACTKCIGSGLCNETVYLSKHGTSYHNASDCSSLKRTVRLIPLNEVNFLSPCSRCSSKKE